MSFSLKTQVKFVKAKIKWFFLKNRDIRWTRQIIGLTLAVTLLSGATLGEALSRWLVPGAYTYSFRVTRTEVAEAVTAPVTVVDASRTKEESVNVVEEPSPLLHGEISIEDKIRKAFGDEGDIAVAVAMCESRLDQTREGDTHLTFSHNGQEYGSSIGLFQIRTGGNDRGGMWFRSDNVEAFKKEMKNADKNIALAKEIHEKSGWSKWSCYTNGLYKNYL